MAGVKAVALASWFQQVASIFKYLGVKGPVGPHATVCGYVKSKHKTNDLYIGNVYPPHR
jgi:hypothetical protein